MDRPGALDPPRTRTVAAGAVISWDYHAEDHGQLDKKRADRVARWARRSNLSKANVIRALIDRAGPIETADDLTEWADGASGKGLGLTQKKP
jgi:hypothetical protein